LQKEDRWTDFTPPADGLFRRFRGRLLHRRSHARLPDGTLVFRGDDDLAYERDGALSDDPSAQNIIWREDHAKLSEIQHGDDRIQKVDAVEHELNSADQEVGIMQERYEDTDEPLSLDELDGMQDIIKGIQEDLTSDLKSLQKSANIEKTESPAMSVEFKGPTQIGGLDSF
ncbi:hypothetical protein, partial [Martelella mangrovi]|uniref:hypothetical protein n=1 Tax=Martelella mangrovi TaxID=1397477 RepID=UPI003390B4E2